MIKKTRAGERERECDRIQIRLVKDVASPGIVAKVCPIRRASLIRDNFAGSIEWSFCSAQCEGYFHIAWSRVVMLVQHTRSIYYDDSRIRKGYWAPSSSIISATFPIGSETAERVPRLGSIIQKTLILGDVVPAVLNVDYLATFCWTLWLGLRRSFDTPSQSKVVRPDEGDKNIDVIVTHWTTNAPILQFHGTLVMNYITAHTIIFIEKKGLVYPHLYPEEQSNFGAILPLMNAYGPQTEKYSVDENTFR
ncbi:uncharacterized protein F5891DRAFT_983583 [Suillus fuscotomentosus]|uniref:Uncharacterized protein n=1 Tax=Suillus fuscotomentosus TaxID=1912939 RepID=A0AAD4E0I2_9AGAM|nr:uncharacterized protein F5891DRAFT_983583 [Suillus fuscotomentosus]KAG1896224.1 hypothetical protein F5891DRAFT_983583 [Suillus fuscotomentosus]